MRTRKCLCYKIHNHDQNHILNMEIRLNTIRNNIAFFKYTHQIYFPFPIGMIGAKTATGKDNQDDKWVGTISCRNCSINYIEK